MLTLLCLFCTISLNAQIVNIPDTALKNLLVNTNVTDTDDNGTADADIDLNNDGEIQQSEANAVGTLYLGFNTGVQSLEGIQFFNNLEELRIRNSQVSIVPAFSMSSLRLLILDNNQISNIDVTNLTNLDVLRLTDNSLSNIDVTQNPDLEELLLDNNNISAIDVTQNPNLENLALNNNSISSINVTLNPNLLTLELNDNSINSINLSQNTLLRLLSLNNNNISVLDVSTSPDISNLELENTLITALDLSSQTTIYYLSVINCPLTSLTGLSNKIELDSLLIKNTNISSLVINNNNAIVSGIEIENNPLLTSIQMNNNNGFFGNNIINNPNLTDLEANNNFDFGLYTDNNGLETIHVDDGNLVDFISINNESNLQELSFLKTETGFTFEIVDCNIDQLILKNGMTDNVIFSGTNTINYACADDTEIFSLFTTLSNISSVTPNINSYCTFTPGGSIYSITGDVRTDLDINGCSASDLNVNDIKFNITDGTTNFTYFESPFYDYSIGLPEGNYTITPEPIYASLFQSLNPFNANFSAGSPDIIQDLCLVPNGNQVDLAVILDEIEPARPGFTRGYRLICSNLGTAAMNGTVFINYDDSRTDYITSSITPLTSTSGNLSWDVPTLQPGQQHTIEIDFRINSPMDTPAVNGGDILVYGGTISTPVGVMDIDPLNNTFEFAQTVVNSFDPNDITCLQGESLDPADVGTDLYYKIRFENTGTASAINVVVRNEIDLTRLDINTFIPLTSSHAMRTRITDGNVVEFIFENINLDFNDATNDGYLIYKIKSLPTLQLGDVIPNQAGIYFDFNFPIITNNYMTTVEQTASVVDENTIKLSVYPNPSSDLVTIEASNTIEKLIIYDHLGRVVRSKDVSSEIDNLDLTELTNGLYFIEVITAGGKQTVKIVKE